MANTRKNLKLDEKDLWYVIGLIASDGCLSSDGRHVDITLKDHDFIDQLRGKLGFKNKIGIKNRGRINQAYHLQIANKNFYELLLSVGLTPRKSLTLRQLKIPQEGFRDFLRGMIDGDGSIRRWKHSTNHKEQWSLTVYSASGEFIEWLNEQVRVLLRVSGRIHLEKRKSPRQDIFILKYGKLAAKVILQECYYRNAFALDRKARLAEACCCSLVHWGRNSTRVLSEN